MRENLPPEGASTPDGVGCRIGRGYSVFARKGKPPSDARGDAVWPWKSRHPPLQPGLDPGPRFSTLPSGARSEEHTSELQSLMRISYAVFCLKQKQILDTVQLQSYLTEHHN